MALVLDGPNAGQEVEIPKDCVTVSLYFPYYPEKQSWLPLSTYENPAETNYCITRYNRQHLRVEGVKQDKEFFFLSKAIKLNAAEILEKLISMATNKDCQL